MVFKFKEVNLEKITKSKLNSYFLYSFYAFSCYKRKTLRVESSFLNKVKASKKNI